jgi:hypothetical protein
VLGTLCFLSPIAWIIELIRDSSYRFNDGLMATIGISVVVIVLFIIGVITVDSWGGYFSKTVLESECPVCGVRATRDYGPKYATNCAHCSAYLRSEGDRVREERLDATGLFQVAPTRYLRGAKQDPRRLSFELPRICATCGSPDARHERKISKSYTPDLPGAAVAGFVVEQIAQETLSHESRVKLGLWGPLGYGHYRGFGRDKSDDQMLENAVHELSFPACDAHVKGGDTPVEHSDVTLWFRSYRYYKEFLAANKIDGPITPPR